MTLSGYLAMVRLCPKCGAVMWQFGDVWRCEKCGHEVSVDE